MPRPSFLLTLIALPIFAGLGLAGCKTIYTDMYRPTRNHFKPEKEKPKAAELLPSPSPLDSLPPAAPQAAPQAPGLEPAPGAAPAAPAPAPGAPPAIPGL